MACISYGKDERKAKKNVFAVAKTLQIKQGRTFSAGSYRIDYDDAVVLIAFKRGVEVVCVMCVIFTIHEFVILL